MISRDLVSQVSRFALWQAPCVTGERQSYIHCICCCPTTSAALGNSIQPYSNSCIGTMPRIPAALLRAVSCLNSSRSGLSLPPAASCSAVNSSSNALLSPALQASSSSIQAYSTSLQHTQKPWQLSKGSSSRAEMPHAFNAVSHRWLSSSATSSSSSGDSPAGGGDSPSPSSSSAASSEGSGSSSLQVGRL